MVVQQVAVKDVQIVNLILQHMVLSVVIQHGMSMAQIVQLWKVIIIGIVVGVNVLVIKQVQLVAQLVVVIALMDMYEGWRGVERT